LDRRKRNKNAFLVSKNMARISLCVKFLKITDTEDLSGGTRGDKVKE